MPAVPSTMLELGTHAPQFSLIEPSTQKHVSLSDFKDKPVLIAFICNHCPYVILLKKALQQFAEDYSSQGLQVIAINANDSDEYPADGPDKMVVDVEDYGYTFPYLFDESQATAALYKAACTPDFFLFDSQHALYYRGQFDSVRPNSEIEATGVDLRNATDNLLKGNQAPTEQLPSIGCSIKWKPENKPDYA